MVKGIRKPKKKRNNTIYSVLTINKTLPKSRQQIYQENYQKNKEKKKQQRRERYRQDKETEKAKQKERYKKDKEKKKSRQKINYAKKKNQVQLTTKQQSAKYYSAESIRVLMSFKEYAELNKDKMKLWTDFNWTLQDCQKAIKEGLGGIVAIMKLEQVAGSLVRDYWETAKKEIRKGKSWNSLDYDGQQKLIRYWGFEKARVENGYIDEWERLEKQGEQYLKDIEMAKYHEERGKIKCECWQCEEHNQVIKEIKAKQKKIIEDYEKEQIKSGGIGEIEWIRGVCNECGEYKKVDSDSGLCRKCSNSEQVA